MVNPSLKRLHDDVIIHMFGIRSDAMIMAMIASMGWDGAYVIEASAAVNAVSELLMTFKDGCSVHIVLVEENDQIWGKAYVGLTSNRQYPDDMDQEKIVNNRRPPLIIINNSAP